MITPTHHTGANYNDPIEVGMIERKLDERYITEHDEIVADAIKLLAVHNDAVEGFKESNSKVSALEQQIQALQHTIQDIQNGVGNHAMVRAQIRGIAEQLLRMTGQESPMLPVPASHYVGGDTSH